MWAEYNLSTYPVVEVTLSEKIKSDKDFEAFLDEWRILNQAEKNFVFIFDTRKVGYVSTRYAFKMASFIKELKKQDYQYLKYNAIITGNWWTRMLLKLIFTLQKPVAPVEYHTSPDTIDLDKLINKTKIISVSNV